MRLAILCGPVFMFGRWISDRGVEVGSAGIDTLGEEMACCT
jgi:hypothetical protein